jgi:hypothetical protein
MPTPGRDSDPDGPIIDPTVRSDTIALMLAQYLFPILSSPTALLARKLTDADGTRRQSNLLKQNSDRPIPARIYLDGSILTTVFSSTNLKSQSRDPGLDRRDIFCKQLETSLRSRVSACTISRLMKRIKTQNISAETQINLLPGYGCVQPK